MRPDPNTPVRNWFSDHPATATYVAVVVTILLLLQVIETIRAF